jgi:hypothetical protein
VPFGVSFCGESCTIPSQQEGELGLVDGNVELHWYRETPSHKIKTMKIKRDMNNYWMAAMNASVIESHFRDVNQAHSQEIRPAISISWVVNSYRVAK